MKNLIKKSIVLVVLFTTLLVNANEISSLRNLKDEKTTMLTLLNVKKGNQLIMKDAFGKVLYRQSISNSGEFVKGFDLTSLPNGKYYFLLKGDLQKKIIPFRINKNVQKVEVYDLTGRLVSTFSGDFYPDKEYDISYLKPSIYLLRISSELGSSSRRLARLKMGKRPT